MGFHTRASGYIGPANPGYCDAASMLSKGWNKVSGMHVYGYRYRSEMP